MQELVLAELGPLLSLHLGVVDAKGNALVLEFEAGTGKLLMHNNPLGILTNEPQLPEQYKLLQQYRTSIEVSVTQVVHPGR